MFNVKWVDSESEIQQSLWEHCFPAPYEGRWWYKALEDAGLQDQFKFQYGIVYDEEKPVAIAPAFLMNVPMKLVVPPFIYPLLAILGHIIPSVLYQRTLFIGSPCSDEGRVGAIEGVDQYALFEAINFSMKEMARKHNVPMLVWKDFTNKDATDLSRMIKNEGGFRLVSFPGTEVSLLGEDKNGYLASLKASRRNKVKKKLRLAANAPIEGEVLINPDSETIQEIFELFSQTYEKGVTKFERLNINFFKLISKYEHAHILVLREKDTKKIVSFMLCFLIGKQVINKFIGIDYQKPKEWFLYFRLWEFAVEWSYSVGAKRIQSGQTGYAPKIELGNELVHLTNYCKHRNPIVNWLYKQGAKTVNWDTLDGDLSEFVKAYPDLMPDFNSK